MSKKNIFAKFQDYVNKPKRNVFDLSFANNITTKFGQLTPVFCKECIPGDSFKIHSRFALQMMPMKFPVQTPMRAYLHFFYVRNRTLYKDWMDFIGGTKDNLTLPYVQPTDKAKFYRVGGLADYLGVPNTLYGDFQSTNVFVSPFQFLSSDIVSNDTTITLRYGLSQYIIPSSKVEWLSYNAFHNGSSSNTLPYSNSYSQFSDLIGSNVSDFETGVIANPNTAGNFIGLAKDIFDSLDSITIPNVNNVQLSPLQRLLRITSARLVLHKVNSIEIEYTGNYSSAATYQKIPMYIGFLNSSGVLLSTAQVFPTDAVLASGKVTSTVDFDFAPYLSANEDITEVRLYQYSIVNSFDVTNSIYTSATCHQDGSVKVTLVSTQEGAAVIGTNGLESTPYDSDIHLNALPFRAYEAIYNSYYRNAQNNPYILDNVAEYNKYIPSYDGGADTNEYDLHQRNWEYDFLTSAVQTPQQGDIAPLVGISVTGEATFQDENGNSYYASAQYDENGNITGWTSHSPNMPQGSLRLLMDMAGTGISINDLRNVNAFQKFLENNIRRGLKYRDQIKSHFGVDVRYDELDMPEFIGGCSTDVSINKLSQTSESGNTPLGSFVGQASAYGESKHDITHYCDEHGFIIGIMSIVPVPVYSQLLPKYFIKSEQLDYFFPEFGHIGYQPILQKEVSPLQTYYSNHDLNKVFGYQRSWYDYLDSTDEVHGQFRTTMRDFLMNRTFDGEPELSKDFLLVDPEQLNDVFLAGTDDSDIYAPEADKIIGSLYFNVSKKSPIPLFGIPRLD